MHATKMDSMALLQQQVLVVTVLCPIAQNVNLWHGFGVEVIKLRIELPAFRQAITGVLTDARFPEAAMALARSGRGKTLLRHSSTLSCILQIQCRPSLHLNLVALYDIRTTPCIMLS